MVTNIKNQYRPSQLAPNAYGWSSSPRYSQADVPTALVDRPSGITAEQFAQQFAYEWYQSGGIERGFTNPPFVGGAAGRTLPSLRAAEGLGPARILRGFIRRAQFEVADPISKARLYFMYNPETITRDYVSYLDQTALDPFNTVYQSGNLIAPPSILDFSFDLFFDRQEEATAVDHPGVYVDYQFFDMVVRNVIPTDPNQSNATLPDNGVMMVNPRNITVVFSPQFTVEGRPLNARVTFEKFTHRMVPTRMRISLTMRAVYMGPIRDMTEYKAEEFVAETSIPIDEITRPAFIFNIVDVIAAGAANGTADPAAAADYARQGAAAGGASSTIAGKALDWAINNVVEGQTKYAKLGGPRISMPSSADCSGLVECAYKAVGQLDAMGWGQYPGTSEMDRIMRANNFKAGTKLPIATIADWDALQYGDLIFKIHTGGVGHVKFFISKTPGANSAVWFDAASSTSNPQVGRHSGSIFPAHNDYSYALRPLPIGQDMSYRALSNPTSATT